MTWDDGYVSQIDYDRGYYPMLNPLAMKLALLANGFQPPNNRPLRYLELGFGQGLSLNIHAAACNGEFWGNDFMPSHANNAKIMAEASGANVTILDDSFAELAARTDLPQFDIIALHGVWTWISAENRAHILQIIESHLALGGIVYISYNISPGSTPMIPVRDLMMLHVNTLSPASADISTKIQDALSFMQQLIDAGAAYLNKSPLATTRLHNITKNAVPTHVIAHEFFNADWSIMPFSEVASHLTQKGLTFCGNAKITDFFSNSLLSHKTKDFLAEINDPIFYESVRDFCTNQMFRADLWAKGGCVLSALQRLQLLGEMRFTLIHIPGDEDLKVDTSIGEIKLDKKMTGPIIAALIKNNFEPKSINDLLHDATLQHLNLSQMCDAMLSLCGVCVAPAHDEETISQLKLKTDKLNTYLINQSRHTDQSWFLVSPVIGRGLSISPTFQLALLAIRDGASTIEEVVVFIWKIAASQGQSMITDEGKLCNGESENISELTLRVTSFFETRLPILTALKIS